MVLAIALLFLVGCGTVTGDVVKSDVVKIGVPLPLTGNLAFFGEWMMNGFELALEDLNENSDVRFELMYEDTVCEPQQTSSALNKLYFADKVDAFAGVFCGSSVKTAAAFVDQNKVMLASPGNNFGKLSDYMFSTEHKVEDESIKLAQYAYNELGLRKVGIIYFHNDWGLEHKRAFSKQFEELGGSITAVGEFEATTRDFRTIITKMLSLDSDGIYVVYSSPGVVFNQIREQSDDVFLLGQRGSENPRLLEIAPYSSEGLVYSYPIAEGEFKDEFVSRYKSEYGEIPSVVALDAYDALMILGDAMKICDGYADCLVEYLSSMESYSGAGGDLKFENGIWDLYRPIQMRTVRNGEFVLV